MSLQFHLNWFWYVEEQNFVVFTSLRHYLNKIYWHSCGHNLSPTQQSWAIVQPDHNSNIRIDIQMLPRKLSSTLCIISARLGTSAGQDKLIEDGYALFDPHLLQSQYVKSIVFMLRSFCSQRRYHRGGNCTTGWRRTAWHPSRPKSAVEQNTQRDMRHIADSCTDN